MLTFVLSNRNRELRTIKNCLDSLSKQTFLDFKVVLVDYGSDITFVANLNSLVSQYHFIKMISCPVQKQLWNKSRAINIALQQCDTPYFFVGDIDMLYRHDFVEKLYTLKKENQAIYFQVGVLSQAESELNKAFEDFVIKHKTNEEATGMTLYPTQLLKEINGYDEFYHGWGAEDTDVHIRLKNSGFKVLFYDTEVLIKHQWHPKDYRQKDSSQIFHTQQERINHAYLLQTAQSKRTAVNVSQEWGKLPEYSVYELLKKTPDYRFAIKTSVLEIHALLAQLKNCKGETVEVVVTDLLRYEKIRNSLKRLLGKKYTPYYDMETINNWMLEEIIKNYRNCPYQYQFKRKEKEINFIINFQS